jgi:single-stranded-DNA-specific exonuclease
MSARARAARSRASIWAAAIQAAFEEGLLMAGGGHAMAAGLSIRPDSIPEFRAFLEERLAGEMEAVGRRGRRDRRPGPAQRADRALYEDFQRLAPFGPGNPEPMFALTGVRPDRIMALKGGHVRMDLVGPSGDRLKAISWRSAETRSGSRLLAGGGALHVVGKLKPDDYMGRNGVQLEIEDAADPRPKAMRAAEWPLASRLWKKKWPTAACAPKGAAIHPLPRGAVVPSSIG